MTVFCNATLPIFFFRCLRGSERVKRHYEKKHLKFSECRGQTRQDKIDRLKLCIEKQCGIFYKQNTE